MEGFTIMLSRSRGRSGFTLIELLVVIAIIAILAAILFPVFAQAREKARQSSCMSNLKQVAISLNMYTQDYDEKFPLAHVEGRWENSGWILAIAPYLKNYGVLRCTSDPLDPREPWEGESLSYAANSYYTNGTNQFKGVLGMSFDYDGDGRPDPTAWVSPPNSRSLAGVTRTAETIMVAEKYDADVFQNTGWMGNRSGLGATQMIYGMGNFWGPGLIPDGGIPGIPARRNGANPRPYPEGPNGAVTAKHSEMSNFAFVDGHVKAMKPIQTNPDGLNRPLDNMWDATR